MTDKELMIKQARAVEDTAAELLAQEAVEVRWDSKWETFRIDVDNTELGWEMGEGWDGPSNTANVLARIILRERAL